MLPIELKVFIEPTVITDGKKQYVKSSLRKKRLAWSKTLINTASLFSFLTVRFNSPLSILGRWDRGPGLGRGVDQMVPAYVPWAGQQQR